MKKKTKQNIMFILEELVYTPMVGMTHVGYLDKVFTTKRKAIDYYDKFHPYMRSINAHRTEMSDWHPLTGKLYIIRKYHGETKTIAPFQNARLYTLKFIATRDLLWKDMLNLFHELNNEPQSFKWLNRAEGGFITGEDEKSFGDIRFKSILPKFPVRLDCNLDNDDVIFKVERDYQNFYVQFKEYNDYYWGYTKIMRIVDIITDIFDFRFVKSHEIERHSITMLDALTEKTRFSMEELNDYFEMDLMKEVKKHSKPREEWPDKIDENLFPCKVCNEPYPHFHYAKDFGDVLKKCVFSDGVVCKVCVQKKSCLQ